MRQAAPKWILRSGIGSWLVVTDLWHVLYSRTFYISFQYRTQLALFDVCVAQLFLALETCRIYKRSRATLLNTLNLCTHSVGSAYPQYHKTLVCEYFQCVDLHGICGWYAQISWRPEDCLFVPIERKFRSLNSIMWLYGFWRRTIASRTTAIVRVALCELWYCHVMSQTPRVTCEKSREESHEDGVTYDSRRLRSFVTAGYIYLDVLYCFLCRTPTTTTTTTSTIPTLSKLQQFTAGQQLTQLSLSYVYTRARTLPTRTLHNRTYTTYHNFDTL